MIKYIIAICLVFMVSPMVIAGYGDGSNIEEIANIPKTKCELLVGKPERLIIREMIGSETMHTIYYGEAKYHCVRCGKSLYLNPVGYYCTWCRTGFNIKKEE